jgi:hypothetical protein
MLQSVGYLLLLVSDICYHFKPITTMVSQKSAKIRTQRAEPQSRRSELELVYTMVRASGTVQLCTM